ALALVFAYLLVQRRVPWRIAGTSALVVAPWVVFATIYFGSPMPYSMTQKMSGDVENPTWEHHIGWIWEFFGQHRAEPLVYLAAAAVLLVPWLARRSSWSATALTVALIWPLVHGLVFSMVELGDAYLWYIVVLYPPMIVAAAVV